MIAETSEMMMMMTIIIEAFFCKSYHLNLTWTHFLGLVITEQLSLSKFGHITYGQLAPPLCTLYKDKGGLRTR